MRLAAAGSAASIRPASGLARAVPARGSAWDAGLWQHAVELGQARPGVPADVAIDVLFSPIVYRLLVGHAPFGPAEAAQLADSTLSGLLTPSRAAPARRHQPAAKPDIAGMRIATTSHLTLQKAPTAR